MHNLALVKALFPRVWLPAGKMALGKSSCLKPITYCPAAPDPSVLQQSKVSEPMDFRTRLSVPVELSAAELPQEMAQPKKAKPAPVKKSAVQQIAPEQPVHKKPAVPRLTVQGPGQFQVATTMIHETLGVVACLPHHQSGLSGQDYLMLSKLIGACRQQLSVSAQPVEFAFFRWPPSPGLAQSLDAQSMGLGALKGFLHKMASKRQCSWLVFDPVFAQFCFQQVSLEAFALLPRIDQQLLIAPALNDLHQHPEQKQKLWHLLKSLLETSSAKPQSANV